MRKKYLFIFSIIILVSCNKKESSSNNFESEFYEDSLISDKNNFIEKENTQIDFDDSKTFDDLYMLSEYEKLQKDETFKNYINEVIESNIKVRLKFFDAEKTIGKSVDLEEPAPTNGSEQKEALLDLGKMAKNMIVDGVKLGVEGYKLNELDNKKKKLYSSFSEDKKKVAGNFEKLIVNIIDDSYNLPVNPKVNKKSKYKNYRSISKALSSDNEANNYCNSLANLADNFFTKAFVLREKINLNKKLGNNTSSSSIKKMSQEILEDPKIEVSSNSIVTDEYFENLKALSEGLNNQDFNVPVEDWSEERKSNFNFIVSDIKTKVNLLVESL